MTLASFAVYRVKEVFSSFCGEGFNHGMLATFIRFAGCNLWSGLERTRPSAMCRFCDTDFVGGETVGVDGLVKLVSKLPRPRLVVLTGGEPALQVDQVLIDAMRALAPVAIETNGTVPFGFEVDWITVSPKTGNLAVRGGDELKVVWPQDIDLSALPIGGFTHHYLQPMWDPSSGGVPHESIAACLAEIRKNNLWRLSLQGHKLVGER